MPFSKVIPISSASSKGFTTEHLSVPHAETWHVVCTEPQVFTLAMTAFRGDGF